MHIYGDIQSGNCYKIKLLVEFLGLPYQWHHVDILNGATQTLEFLQKNPNGKIPLVEFENGQTLAESNAILNYLAQGTSFIPQDAFNYAEVLQWQFFEQYSHEPYIAVARYIAKYLGLPADRKQDYLDKQEGGHKALAVMEQQLLKTPFLTGADLTIADISLFAYTHVADEGGFDLSLYSAIQSWIERIKNTPNYVSMAD
ncbi:glutathione S-transferase family protein [Algibacillus agarilyticus]|uniref:glutathione S-transferase family protein n=1 Tax=Algibacillus agarilyticus TaxID=2234133 RepID=UPI000DCFFF34|nr:glutathione S-transferase family protein [Algibacillus agarilyticus]